MIKSALVSQQHWINIHAILTGAFLRSFQVVKVIIDQATHLLLVIKPLICLARSLITGSTKPKAFSVGRILIVSNFHIWVLASVS